MLNVAFRIILVSIGILIIGLTIVSALRSFVVPRGISDRLAKTVFTTTRRLFNLRLKFAKSYSVKDRVMAYYAPTTLVCFPVIWLTLVMTGFAFVFKGISQRNWADAFKLSGSAITTLGFATADPLYENLLIFAEAIIGLILVAILISYLPTMYSAWSEREMAVTKLDVRAGSPPSAIELIQRAYRIGSVDRMTPFWAEWEDWFTSVEETHTSLPALSFYRSPVPEYNWVIAAGTVLDSAALFHSVIDKPRDPQEDLCLRAGYLTLRRIAGLFGVPINEFLTADDPISITRQEFDQACNELAAAGVPLKADRDLAWHNFKGWRVNYDAPLLAMCNIVMAPYAPWSSDRAHLHRQFAESPIFFQKK
ncbi:MAG: hypothetical protein ACI9EW_003116 [Cellvibrionaceae bacterium]|jgi:hypothetical protein